MPITTDWGAAFPQMLDSFETVSKELFNQKGYIKLSEDSKTVSITKNKNEVATVKQVNDLLSQALNEYSNHLTEADAAYISVSSNELQRLSSAIDTMIKKGEFKGIFNSSELKKLKDLKNECLDMSKKIDAIESKMRMQIQTNREFKSSMEKHSLQAMNSAQLLHLRSAVEKQKNKPKDSKAYAKYETVIKSLLLKKPVVDRFDDTVSVRKQIVAKHKGTKTFEVETEKVPLAKSDRIQGGSGTKGFFRAAEGESYKTHVAKHEPPAPDPYSLRSLHGAFKTAYIDCLKDEGKQDVGSVDKNDINSVNTIIDNVIYTIASKYQTKEAIANKAKSYEEFKNEFRKAVEEAIKRPVMSEGETKLSQAELDEDLAFITDMVKKDPKLASAAKPETGKLFLDKTAARINRALDNKLFESKLQEAYNKIPPVRPERK